MARSTRDSALVFERLALEDTVKGLEAAGSAQAIRSSTQAAVRELLDVARRADRWCAGADEAVARAERALLA